MRKLLFVSMLLLQLFVLIGCKKVDPRPVEQIKFEEKMISLIQEYKNSNEVKQAQLKQNRASILENLIPNRNIKNWVGTVIQLETTTMTDNAIFGVRVGEDPYIEIKTWNNGLSDKGDSTIIHTSTVLYKQLMELKHGDKVSFSGEFIAEKKDFLRESSLTQDGSMLEPEFVFRFSKVQKIEEK